MSDFDNAVISADATANAAVESGVQNSGTAMAGSGDAPPTQDQINAVVGNVRKKAYQKGLEEGRLKALAELEQKQLPQQAPIPEQMGVQPTSNAGPMPSSGLNVDDLAQRVSQRVEERDKMRRYEELGNRAFRKYGTQYQQNLQAYLSDQDRDKHVLLEMATQYGNEDLLNKLVSDPEVVKNITQYNSNSWSQRLMEAANHIPSQTATASSMGRPLINVNAAEPAQSLDTSSSGVDGNNMTGMS